MTASHTLTLIPLLAALALAGCGKGGSGAGGPGQMPPPPVTAVEVAARAIAVEAVYAGRLHGLREVEVRARVGGILEERLYQEGQYIGRGAALFRIDPKPHAIALQAAEAELANARAAASQAAREWRRAAALFGQDAVSERERDAAESADELARARVRVAEAQVAEARLNMEYTTVTAPIAGRTGLESVPEGSLIERGALLTTIVQQDPVQARFALPERDAAIRRGAPPADQRMGAALILPDGSEYALAGVVDFTDSTVDARTGSVRARALFDNPEGALVPGQFVRVRVQLQLLEDAFTVPAAAIGSGPGGTRVFVLGADNTVAAREVRLGPVVDGAQVVTEGLRPGDRVVTSGLVMLQPGMTVAPRMEEKE